MLGLAACGGAVDGGPAGTTDTTVTPPTTTTTTTTVNENGTTETTAFASATYSDCTWLTTGGTLEGEGLPTSTLALTASGSSVIATFTSDGQPTTNLQLVATSGSSATLSSPNQGFPGTWGFCGGGVSANGGIASPAPSAATLSLSAASVTVDNGLAFLSMTGRVTDNQGFAGCAPDDYTFPLSAQLVCGTAALSVNPGGQASKAGPTGAGFTPGTYDCTGDTQALVGSGGIQYGTGGTAGGSLALTRASGELTATYSGDAFASGTIVFVPTSDTSANPLPAQSVDVGCGIVSTGPTLTYDPTDTTVTGGALTTDGTTLFLTFLGAVKSGGCSGQTSSTALQCTPHP